MPSESTPLDELERNIRSFKIECTRYLNAGTDLPPEALRRVIKTTLRRLQDDTRSTADRFRLGSLEARFNTLNEFFNRQVVEREEGRGRSAPVDQVDNRRFVIGDELERDTAAALYQSLYGDSAKATSIDFETFISYLETQRDLIRNRIGCSRVQFRVAQEDGKRKLKARPAIGQ